MDKRAKLAENFKPAQPIKKVYLCQEQFMRENYGYGDIAEYENDNRVKRPSDYYDYGIK